MELSNEELIEEWKKHDPLLEDLEGFQRFCDIKVAGGDYPLNQEDLFLTVKPPRREWQDNPSGGCAFVHDCVPRETSDDYWKRNNEAAKAVMNSVADWLGHDPKVDWKPKDDLGIPLHLNDSSRHHGWVKDVFGVSLTRKDYEEAWMLFEHKSWFDDRGYYIRGWLAVAEALGMGEAARKVLETTPYPHADSPQVKPEDLCSHMETCPIYQYREYLKVTPIEIPEDLLTYHLFQSNCIYYTHTVTEKMFKEGEKDKILEEVNSPRLSFKVKWKIRNMIRRYMQLPRCRVLGCNAISYHVFRDEVDEVPLCWEHQQLIYQVWRTKMKPKGLRKSSKKKGQLFEEWEHSIPPKDVERELRIRLVEGDPIFDDNRVKD